MENKILLLTEAGSEIGYGHLMRMMALYEEIESRGENPLFIINGDSNLKDLLIDKNFILNDWRNIKFLKEQIDDKTFVIVDSYLADLKIYNYISNLALKALYIDDNMRINYPKGIVVNPSIYSPNLDYPKKNDLYYLLGLDYIILRKEFFDIEEKVYRERIENILIIFGGSDFTNMTPRILKFLTNNYPDLKKHIVIGKGFKNIEEIKLYRDDNTKFYYNLNAGEMKNLMLNSDLAITATGQTIYELIRCNTPFIPIKVVENQENNMNGLLKVGIIDALDFDWKEKFKEFIIENKKIEYNLIDGKGAGRIIDYLLKGD